MTPSNDDTPRDEFRDLFEEAPIPYVHEAMDTRFIRMNRAARELLGVRPDEVETTFGLELVVSSSENQQQLQAALQAIREGRETHGLILEMRRKDNGQALWVEWSTKPAPSHSYSRTMLVDVSRRVLLQQAKAALEFSLESGQVGEWDLDLIHDISRRSLRHDLCFGYAEPVPATAWGVKTFIAHVHPHDRARVDDTMREAMLAGVNWGSEFRVVWPDGSVHWLVAKGNVYHRTSDGRAARMLGIVMDITERKRTDEALAASEQLARGQVDALTSTLNALAMETVPDRLLEHVLCAIAAQLGAHSSSVWRVDEASQQMLFHSSYEAGQLVMPSDPSMSAAELSLPFEDEWPWPEAFHTRRPVIMEDIRTMPAFPWQARLVALGVVTILVTPMCIGGRVDGLIGIRFTGRRSFNPEELELALAMTNQATLSMHLMRLSVQSREAAVVAERNRMARDIHDTLAQGLTGVIVQLEAAVDARQRGLGIEADQHVDRAQGLARESLTEARRSVRALRPQEFDDKDLGEALEALIRRMTAGTTVSAGFVLEGAPRKLPPAWEDNLLRSVQEVLTNVLRHAQASDFEVHLLFEPGEIRLDLRDNGRGFDPERKSDGFGLLGVRERVQAMEGRMTLVSAEGRGTHFSIALPLPGMGARP